MVGNRLFLLVTKYSAPCLWEFFTERGYSSLLLDSFPDDTCGLQYPIAILEILPKLSLALLPFLDDERHDFGVLRQTDLDQILGTLFALHVSHTQHFLDVIVFNVLILVQSRSLRSTVSVTLLMPLDGSCWASPLLQKFVCILFCYNFMYSVMPCPINNASIFSYLRRILCQEICQCSEALICINSSWVYKIW